MNIRKRLALAFGTLGLTLFGAAALATPSSAADFDRIEVPLHNNEAEAETGESCPTDGAAYWHFVLAPNNGSFSFVTVFLLLGTNEAATPTIWDPDTARTSSTSAYVYTVNLADMTKNGQQTDNVFVKVPAGYEIDDLVLEGSSAVIAPYGSAKFVLSHVCDGSVPPTTTTTTTTTAATTTTTTTTPDVPTTELPTTTETVDQEPPTVTTIRSEIPKTGGALDVTLVAGLSLTAIGVAIALATRRP